MRVCGGFASGVDGARACRGGRVWWVSALRGGWGGTRSHLCEDWIEPPLLAARDLHHKTVEKFLRVVIRCQCAIRRTKNKPELRRKRTHGRVRHVGSKGAHENYVCVCVQNLQILQNLLEIPQSDPSGKHTHTHPPTHPHTHTHIYTLRSVMRAWHMAKKKWATHQKWVDTKRE